MRRQVQLALTEVPMLPPSRRRDPETSKLAARAVAADVETHCERIMEVLLQTRVPLTFREIAQKAEMDPVAVMRRLSPQLVKRGLVIRCRARKCSTLGGGGRAMTTWLAVRAR